MKLFKYFLVITPCLMSATPHMIDPEAGYKRVRVELEIGIKGDQVIVTHPLLLHNDYMDVECHCGLAAIQMNIKNGAVIGYCQAHIPKFDCSCGCIKRDQERKALKALSKKNKQAKS